MAGPLGGWYRGTKFALESLSDTLSLKVNPFGIDVLVIEPGAVRTEFTEVAVDALLTASGPGPEGQLTKAIIKSMASEDMARSASPPTVINEAIHRAVTSRRPNTLYASGFGASFMLFARKVLSDRWFGAAVMRAFATHA